MTSCTVGEVHLIEIAGNTRTDFDGIDRDEATDILVPLDDGSLDGRCDRDLRRRRTLLRALLGAAFAAGGEREQEKRTGTEPHPSASLSHGYLAGRSA